MPLQVKFHTTFRDVIRANLYQAPRTLALQILVAPLLIWVSWTFYDTVAKLNRSLLTKIITFSIMEFAILLVIALAGGVGLVLITFLMYMPGHNKIIYSEQEITLTDEGIIFGTQFTRSEATWSAVQRVNQSKSDIYVFLTQHGGHVIPKRAFASKDEAEAYYQFILAHRKIALGNAPI